MNKMPTFFRSLDNCLNPQPEFWQSVNESILANEPDQIYFCQLQVAEADNEIELCQLALIGTKLYKFEGEWDDPIALECVDLKWKVADCFADEEDEDRIYGFSFEGLTSFIEFYANDLKELMTWVDLLSKICILTGFYEQFQTINMIGVGSTAQIYSVSSIQDGQVFAAKKISKANLLDNHTSLTALANEIEAMRKISHKNLVRMHQIYDTTDDVVILLDHIPYGTLASRLTQRKKFDEVTACKIIWNVLDAVEHIHTMDFIHRDLKLENILMASEHDDTDIRVADFGLSAQGVLEVHSLRAGSPGYIAPEILESQPYGHKIDIFSVGVILYALLTGEMPFNSTKFNQLIELNREASIKLQSDLLGNISVLGLGMLRDLTNPNPELRVCATSSKNSAWFTNTLVHAEDWLLSPTTLTPTRLYLQSLLKSPSGSPWANCPSAHRGKSRKRLSNLSSPMISTRAPRIFNSKTENANANAIQIRHLLKNFSQIESVSLLASSKQPRRIKF